MTYVSDARAEADARRERECYQDGRLLMLHHNGRIAGGKLHPDAGRIGRIVSCERMPDGRPVKGGKLVVEFFSDDLVGSATFCLIPVGHWMPIFDWMAEEYEPRAKKRGWRLSPQGLKIFKSMGWEFTPATEGKDLP
jgi:hypothetical protein